MGRWEILPSKWFITRTPSVVFPSKSIVHLLSSAIFVFLSRTLPILHLWPSHADSTRLASNHRTVPISLEMISLWLQFGYSAYMWLHRLRIPKENIYYIQYIMTILSPRHPPLEAPRSRLSTVGTRKTWRSCLTRSHPDWVQVRLR